MHPQTRSSVIKPRRKRLSWFEIWTRVLTNPSTHTFEDTLLDPAISARRAYGWVFFSTLLSVFTGTAFLFIMPNRQFPISDIAANRNFLLSTYGLILLCSALLYAVIAVLSLMINTAIVQWIATGLNGWGSYTNLVYALAAFIAPITLIASPIAFIPYVNLISFFFAIYSLVLTVIAIKAVNRFSLGRAIASLLLVWIGVIVLVALLVVVVLVLLTSNLNQLYQEILHELTQNIPLL